MIDVTNANAKVGDQVVLFDNENITLDEISEICDTINYEILSTINERVPRIFIGGNNETN
jgi:alanine racemase